MQHKSHEIVVWEAAGHLKFLPNQSLVSVVIDYCEFQVFADG